MWVRRIYEFTDTNLTRSTAKKKISKPEATYWIGLNQSLILLAH